MIGDELSINEISISLSLRLSSISIIYRELNPISISLPPYLATISSVASGILKLNKKFIINAIHYLNDQNELINQSVPEKIEISANKSLIRAHHHLMAIIFYLL